MTKIMVLQAKRFYIECMNIDTKTIGQLALEEPKAISVLENLNIDYCCRGNRPVAQACKEAGITINELFCAIGGAPKDSEARDWSSASLKELQSFIVNTHHAFTRDMLSTVNQLAAKVAQRHGERHPEVLRVKTAVQQLVSDLLPHMMKEEQVLFPYIEELESGDPQPPFFGTVQNPIRMMMMEHDAAADILNQLRITTDHYKLPDDACISFRALYERLTDLEKDLHRHIHLENNVLFPRAAEMETRVTVG
jgi:regulator of cell morphogenesis and NO signaling